MKLNTPESLRIGRAVLRENGNSWTKVYSSGKRRSDGVIIVRSDKVAPMAKTDGKTKTAAG